MKQSLPCCLVAIATSVLLPEIAYAAELSFSSTPETIGPFLTDFPTAQNPVGGFTLPRFDGNLGTLTGVTFTFDGEVKGTVRLENASPSSIDEIATLSANLNILGQTSNLTTPSSSVLGFSASSDEVKVTLDPADADEGKGKDYYFTDKLNGKKSEQISFTDDLNFFVGNQPLQFQLTAKAISSAQGSGNVDRRVRTFALGKGTIIYQYNQPTPTPTPTPTPNPTPTPTPTPTEEVPEPTTLLGVAIAAGLGIKAKRKKNR
jgi:hypothetical protein